MCWATFTAILGCTWPMDHRLDTPDTMSRDVALIFHLVSIILTTACQSWTDLRAQNAGVLILKNVLFTTKALNFSLFFGTLLSFYLTALPPILHLHNFFLAKLPYSFFQFIQQYELSFPVIRPNYFSIRTYG